MVVVCSFPSDSMRTSADSSVKAKTEKTGTEIVIIRLANIARATILLKSSLEKLMLGYLNSFPHATQKFRSFFIPGLQFGQSVFFGFVVKIWIFQIFSDRIIKMIAPKRIRTGPPKR